MRQRLGNQPNWEQEATRLLNMLDQSTYEYKKLDSHCEKLRQIVVEYELKGEKPEGEE